MNCDELLFVMNYFLDVKFVKFHYVFGRGSVLYVFMYVTLFFLMVNKFKENIHFASQLECSSIKIVKHCADYHLIGL